MQTEGSERLYMKGEAARLLRVSESTVQRQLKARNLGYKRVGTRVLISERHIHDFLALCERRAARHSLYREGF
jgi:excisionase family DNA binding protein